MIRQLDQNKLAENSDYKTSRSAPKKKVTYNSLRDAIVSDEFNGGYNITQVTGSNGKALHHVINGTMMRVDLPKKPYSFFFKFYTTILKQKIIKNKRTFAKYCFSLKLLVCKKGYICFYGRR